MSLTEAGTLKHLGSRALVFGRMIRFSHSIFALPFALAGVLFAAHASGRYPPPVTWLWVVVAMVGARTSAMAFNRIVDRRIDAANPRTAGRALPQGTLSPAAAAWFTLLAAAAFVLAAAQINRLALVLSPLALGIIFFYSFTKRFTWTSHFFLGLALAVAPVGGWVAVTGRLEAAPFVLGLGVLAWVAGFDIFYAFQDLEFDRGHGLHSLPARFGIRGGLVAARLLHGVAVAALVSLAPLLHLSPWYLVGVGVVAMVLFHEHRLVRVDDLSRLNRAFFDMNAVVGVIFLVSATLGVFL